MAAGGAAIDGGRSGIEGKFIRYFEIPSPNTTVFSVLWPPSIALCVGSSVFPYTLVVQLEAFTGT
jgi:hypothetical protein